MNNSETLFITTVFPKSEKYLDDFFYSLKNQSYKNFKILIINDGISDIQKILSKFSTLKIIEKKVTGTPSENREYGINKAIELNCSKLIFGDSDDFFSNNRIEECINELEKYDIVFNKIETVNIDGMIIKNNFFDNLHFLSSITIKDILSKNIIGFSNSAINLSKIRKKIFPKNLIAVDWWFYSTLLLEGMSCSYLNTATTFYRQHESNLVGASSKFDDNRLEKILTVKLNHYSAMAEYSSIIGNVYYKKYYSDLETEMKNLKQKLTDRSFKNFYIRKINDNFEKIYQGWWSEAIPLNEFEKL